ncbi:Uncharacterised protein [Enterobacter hormaechei]|uniref:hypothetical protein n=1 Tax=Enterobacter hormaechei TaxID=158836 RepID=UPI0012510CC2|nr:hypothetical protein [Enterobacter hormaechei]VAM30220.1 Uncharacterised protein [Enterobacter hormaechei]VAM39434.1 Uncharacterised protein [Enterobacter hormaechei]
MNVKRYEWVACDEHACHCDVVESAEGDMVDYEDYAALEARCAALAAENAGLKAANAEGCKWDGEQWVGISIETPATDAFLAEVRAQGVERLAKVWYAIANETDPGISISESSRLKYRQRADDAAEFANDIRHEAAQLRKGVQS